MGASERPRCGVCGLWTYGSIATMPPRKSRISMSCTHCGLRFERLECQIRPGSRPFCSNACIAKEKRHGSTLFCEWCDSEFYRRFGEQDQGIKVRQFCSRICYKEWREHKRTSYPKDGPRHRHRIVAEAVLGRPLRHGEVVHHIDEDRQNCQPSNLCVFPSQSEHARCHFGKMDAHELDGFKVENVALREQLAAAV